MRSLLQGFLADAGEFLADFRAVTFDQIFDQHQDVVCSFAQGRYLKRDDVQPTEEVASKRAGGDSCVSSSLFAVATPVGGQSTLPRGVKEVSPQAAKSIADPEQLDARTPGHLVQDMHAAFGSHRARAAHSSGTIVLGSFAPSPEARSLSSAELFKAGVPVIVRFSSTLAHWRPRPTSLNAAERREPITVGVAGC